MYLLSSRLGIADGVPAQLACGQHPEKGMYKCEAALSSHQSHAVVIATGRKQDSAPSFCRIQGTFVAFHSSANGHFVLLAWLTGMCMGCPSQAHMPHLEKPVALACKKRAPLECCFGACSWRLQSAKSPWGSKPEEPAVLSSCAPCFAVFTK